MVLALHGEAGGWDELLIAVVAFGVMWAAVKLAGRKPAVEDETDAQSDEVALDGAGPASADAQVDADAAAADTKRDKRSDAARRTTGKHG
jgi:hypothetical protein